MFYWNPHPDAFTIPFLDMPIKIYGICFAAGFLLGYLIFQRLLVKRLPFLSKEIVQGLVDKLTWFVIGGTIIGARLGHVFFYDWDRYRAHPWLIFNLREGGLASHGGTVGGTFSSGYLLLVLFSAKRPIFPFLACLI